MPRSNNTAIHSLTEFLHVPILSIDDEDRVERGERMSLHCSLWSTAKGDICDQEDYISVARNAIIGLPPIPYWDLVLGMAINHQATMTELWQRKALRITQHATSSFKKKSCQSGMP